MSEHTPGPWMYDGYKANDGNRYIFDAQGIACIAVVPGGIYNETPEDAEETADANARLIATAPELLAELEKLEWVICASDLSIFECPSCLGVTKHRNDCTLNAVIKKARGRVAGKVAVSRESLVRLLNASQAYPDHWREKTYDSAVAEIKAALAATEGGE